MRIVMLSHTGITGPFRVGSHHLAREFARHGHRVAHVSNPISLGHVLCWRDPEVRARARAAVPPRVHPVNGAGFVVPWALLPLTPNPLRVPLTLGSTTVLRRMLRRADLLPADVLLVDQPLFAHLIPALPHRRLVYRPTDVAAGPAPARAERTVVAQADAVIATSSVVADNLPPEAEGKPCTVVPNGVEIDHFASVRRPWDERRGAVYVGALDGRFDWAVVQRLAEEFPADPFDLYGPRPTAPPLPTNVRLAGPVDYAAAPEVMADHRVGLLPLNADRLNGGRSPMKLFEYLASGLSVLSRHTEPIAAHQVSSIHLYDDADAATSAYKVASAAKPAGDGYALAESMDWSRRAELVLSHLERAC